MEFVFEASIFILKINLIFLGKSQARQRLRSVLLNSENETKMPKTVSFALVPFDAIQLWVKKKIPNSASAFSLLNTNEIKRANFLGRRKT